MKFLCRPSLTLVAGPRSSDPLQRWIAERELLNVPKCSSHGTQAGPPKTPDSLSGRPGMETPPVSMVTLFIVSKVEFLSSSGRIRRKGATGGAGRENQRPPREADASPSGRDAAPRAEKPLQTCVASGRWANRLRIPWAAWACVCLRRANRAQWVHSSGQTPQAVGGGT